MRTVMRSASLCLGFAIVCAGFCCAFADSAAAAQIDHTGYEQLTFEGTDFYVFRVDLRASKVETVWKGADGKPLQTFGNAIDFLRSRNVEPTFITNAGIFTPDFSPCGLYVEGGEVGTAINRRDGKGNFHLKPNGVFYLGDDGAHILDSESVTNELIATMKCATQSGPLLVSKGNIHKAFRPESYNRKIRSGVGVRTPSDLCFVLSKDVVNFHRFARLFVERLHCDDALYLDGVISRFTIPGKPELNDEAGKFAAMLFVTER